MLTGEERDQLTRWVRRAKTSQALALRAKIVLACARGRRISRPPRICWLIPATVSKWRQQVRRAAVRRAG